MQNVIIPIEIIRRKDIGSTSKFVYGYLKSYFEKNNSFPTIKEIAIGLFRSSRVVSFAIRELKKCNILHIKRTGKANFYEFNADMNKVFTSEDKLVNADMNKVFTSEAPKKRKIRIIDLDNLPCFRKNVPDMNKGFTSEDKLVGDIKPSKNIDMNKGFISKDNELDHIEYGDPEFLETSTCNHQYASKTLYKNCPKEHENFKSVFESAAMLGMPKSLNNKLNDALLNFGLEYVKWTLELILFSTQREKIAEALVFNWRTINPDYNGSIVRTNL